MSSVREIFAAKKITFQREHVFSNQVMEIMFHNKHIVKELAVKYLELITIFQKAEVGRKCRSKRKSDDTYEADVWRWRRWNEANYRKSLDRIKRQEPRNDVTCLFSLHTLYKCIYRTSHNLVVFLVTRSVYSCIWMHRTISHLSFCKEKGIMEYWLTDFTVIVLPLLSMCCIHTCVHNYSII